MRPDPRRQPLLTIVLIGFAATLLAAAGGWLLERVRLGASDAEASARVEHEVRASFDRMSDALRRAAAELALAAGPVTERPADERDVRGLFERAEVMTSSNGSAVHALTVYGPDATPLAWSGRPSELPRERLTGAPALFVTPGPLGIRLVCTAPVVPPSGGAAVGTVAAERLLTPQVGVPEAGGPPFAMQTSLAPVSLRTRYEGAGEGRGPFTFVVHDAAGEPLVEAAVEPARLAETRSRHRRTVLDICLAIAGVTLLLLAGPLLDRRARQRSRASYCGATALVAALMVAARLLVWRTGSASSWRVFSSEVYRSVSLGPLLRHPADFLATALLALGIVALLAGPAERWRLNRRSRRRPLHFGIAAWPFLVCHLVVGAVLALSVLGYERFLAEVFTASAIDILYFSPDPWNTARMALVAGLVLYHAAFAWAVVLGLRSSLASWRFQRGDGRVVAGLLLAWGAPVAIVWTSWPGVGSLPQSQAVLLSAALAVAAFQAPRGLTGLRHASRGYRLVAMFLALLAPAIVTYPSLVHFEDLSKRRVIEERFAPEALTQLESVQRRLVTAQDEIDQRQEVLGSVVSVPAPAPGAAIPPESAFLIWQGTALERYRVSSAVELYNASEQLVSRFALNLPEDASRQRWHEESCSWQTFGESSPFGAQERQLLHAGRNVCTPDGVAGTIVIHVILDDSTLSFLSSQDPYFELLRGGPLRPREEAPGRDVEYAVYGWSRSPLYLSGDRAWPIDDDTFERIAGGREPFWTRIQVEDRAYDVYFANDRRAIYALGYPKIPPIGHLINLAELVALVALVYGALLVGNSLFRTLGLRRPTSGRGLLREIRESFYRKLSLAFVVVAVIPVVTLALVTRVYIAEQLRHDVETAAHNTTAIARQMIEELSAVRGEGQTLSALNDDHLVALSRVVGQDVNVYVGARLLGTSERDLFASGLLPTRTPADVYRAILLDRLPTVITEEQAGDFRYMVAGAPVRAGQREALLTVPLTSRQQEIEREIEDLDRRIVLAAMLFILVGAAFGYPLAERIADPVNRLMRATRRLSRGDFNVRIATTATDELKRLVEAFNTMSAELLRQRVELQRTHRLEAWAEMARQVAHEIKNPLTPIQLSAEHLRRVHSDRGRPLDPVLEECVDSILSQVRLLRQIASEFSSFAVSPTARLAPTALSELVEEVLRPYTAGAGHRIDFSRNVPTSLPLLQIDRALVGRALTNVIDNALHAMPGTGSLAVTARLSGDRAVELRVTDSGVGMDDEAMSRLFEPYFSTKAVGTGLGLSIARRNVELNGGTIAVASARNEGTTVTIILPVAGSSGPPAAPPAQAG